MKRVKCHFVVTIAYLAVMGTCQLAFGAKTNNIINNDAMGTILDPFALTISYDSSYGSSASSTRAASPASTSYSSPAAYSSSAAPTQAYSSQFSATASMNAAAPAPTSYSSSAASSSTISSSATETLAASHRTQIVVVRPWVECRTKRR